MKNKITLVIMLSYVSLFSMQPYPYDTNSFSPSPAQVTYIENLFKSTLDWRVRSYMSVNPQDAFVHLLNRYISISTINFWKKNYKVKKLPTKLTTKDFLSFVCHQNLVELFQVKTSYDMQICVATLGAVYDFEQPCKTWEHILVVAQEQIKRKIRPLN